MTVTYSLDVASSSFFCLYKLLFRWKGSIWKSIYTELLLWCVLYGILSVIYRLFLSKPHREIFEDICVFFDTYSGFIPITFMLGFYVTAVFNRWWQIFENIGWIDTPCLWIAQYINGTSERARMIRRNCIRYCILTQAMVFRDVAASVRKRFPTFNHLVTAGLMTENEMKEFDSIKSPHAKYWQPMHWLFSLVKLAKDEGMISSDYIYIDLMEKLRQFRVNILSLTLYDWVPVPLVYTQVVHLGVRSYFAIALLGRQYLNPTRDLGVHKTIDLYIPIMSILQMIFFVGWMKVAEVLLNPLGEDDDDFECNWVLDRNLQVGLMVVDTAYSKYPNLEKDTFWEDLLPEPLYTAESAMRPLNPQVGSCADMPTEEENFMLRPRRRTISRSSRWDENVEDADVVPVYNLRKLKDGSNYASGESLAFSQTFQNGQRRLSEMFKRMRTGSRIGDHQRRPKYSLDAAFNEEGLPPPNHLSSAKSSSNSLNRFGETFHNRVDSAPEPEAADPPRLWHSMPQTSLEELMRQRNVQGPLKYHADGMKERRESTDSKHERDQSPHPPNSPIWQESLPVIEEEDPEKRRNLTDTESLKSHSVKSSTASTPGGIPRRQSTKEEETTTPRKNTPDRPRKWSMQRQSSQQRRDDSSDSSSEMESRQKKPSNRKPSSQH
ncbi:unnamed protein product [Caenorhabditis auriculariae]|uniref:Bestrophin homolog n=1 Tax=Caenorhabditis auriculariae TaxID=2777116 RepID=A0A8S1I0G2_9PELO|nr:unnamed protein product [Caenorhabditis auriculariae]